MSFGRTPYYIYRCSNRGSEDCPSVDHVHFDGAAIEWDALAQFVASAANRQPPDELLELLRRGKALRPDIPPTLEVQVTGAGWVDAPGAEAATLPRGTAADDQAEAQARRTGKEPPPPEFVLKFFATLMSRKVLREHLLGRGG